MVSQLRLDTECPFLEVERNELWPRLCSEKSAAAAQIDFSSIEIHGELLVIVTRRCLQKAPLEAVSRLSDSISLDRLDRVLFVTDHVAGVHEDCEVLLELD